MDNHIYLEGCQDWLIVSPTPIIEAVSEGLQAGYKLLLFQVLGGMPIVCVCVSDESGRGNEFTYPIVYPGTTIVPVWEWSDVRIAGETILINDVFVSTFLGKSVCDTSLTDLLGVFEVLADPEQLSDFEDRHGLVIGGVRCGI